MIFLCNPTSFFFMGMTDEAGMVSAVSNQKKNKKKQRIRFATMSTKKWAKRMPRERKHTITSRVYVRHARVIKNQAPSP